MILVDTNVLIAATHRVHADFDLALNLLTTGGALPVAPHLWRYEYVHVLSRQARLGKVTFEEATEGFSVADDFLSRELGAPDFARVFALSKAYTVTGQDAVFLFWAQALGTPLVTFDKKLRRAAPGLTVAPG